MSGGYEYALAITSQFPFCSIPLRLDSYSACQFACRYCFAASRGGSTGQKRIRSANPRELARRLERLAKGSEARSVLDEMLAARIPIHFGGMSDPMMPLEGRLGVSLDLLKILHDHSYPTILSTKSDLCATDPYCDVLAAGNFIVQISLPTLSEGLASRVDAGAPSITRRLNAVRILSAAGIPTACRVQPFLARDDEANDLVLACAEAGAKQLAVEHLKLALEDSSHRRGLSVALDMDLVKYYKLRDSPRVGREWVLPVEERVRRMLKLRQMTHSAGMLFGAADNDLLHLSDGTSCCSSVDQLGFKSPYRFTFTQAIHAHKDGRISFSAIADEWRPRRSIGQYVNSKSRIPRGSIEDYIRAHWNGYRHGSALDTYFGVSRTNEKDEDGFVIYTLAADVRYLLLSGDQQPLNACAE
ncbi:radical SAM protein [Mesorhizobium sp. Cs1321R2N1]|uniref:radical SAM protein n=1 Tax=Mesorhizobium sp. Cs1321R2N1 TaxID=3015174 RepID=UPI00301CF047